MVETSINLFERMKIKTNNDSYQELNIQSREEKCYFKENLKFFRFLCSYISMMHLIFGLICSFVKPINSHVCGFDSYPHKKPEILQMELNENLNEIEKLLEKDKINSPDGNLKKEENRFLQTNSLTPNSTSLSSFQPIRIYYDFTTLDSQSTTYDPNFINGAKKILSNCQIIFQNILGVKRYNTKLRLRYCDQNVKISTQVATGIDSDIVIFPFFDSTLINTSTEAYATACIISSVDNRPVAGLIGISPKFSINKANWESYYTNLALHELSHVIVFNPNLFEFFRDPNGNPYNSQDVIKSSFVNGIKRNLLAYPKVLEKAKKHFNCSEILGVELENQGGQGTAASHWESRIMLGDYMIGLSFDDTAISEITLALFEDSGWYSVNYYTGGLFKFGKNKGCDFLNKKCIENNVPLTTDEFCVTPYQSLCVSNRLNRGICYITDTSNPDNSSYQYFTKPSTGGLFMSDFCPVIAVPTNNTYFYPWSCAYGISNYPVEFDENISESSACFMSNVLRNSADSRYFSNFYRATCYQYQCDFDNLILKITVGAQTINCPKQGGLIQIPTYNGNVVCPDFYKICTSKPQCKDMISCAINKVLPIDAIYNYITVNPIINSNTNQITTNPNTAQTTTTTTTTTITTTTSTISPIQSPTTVSTNPTSSTPITSTINPISNPTSNPTTKPTVPPIVPPITTNPNVNTTINVTIYQSPIDYNKTLTKDDGVSNIGNINKYSFILTIFTIIMTILF